MFDVSFLKLHIGLQILEDTFLPQFKESAIRGGIGQSLLESYCVKRRDCDTCPGRLGCVYANIMYSNFLIKPSFVTIGESISFVLTCNDRREMLVKGDILEFTMTLFGGTFRYFYQIMQAIADFGKKGLGKYNVKFSLDAIKNRKGQMIYDNGNIIKNNINVESLKDYIAERKQNYQRNSSVQMAFLSPCTMKYRGEFQERFEASALTENLCRRLYMLNCFAGIEKEVEFFDEAQIPIITKQLVQGRRVKRYSNHKKMPIYLKGIEGFVWLEKMGENLLDYFIAGEITHIGKNTRFGFGNYTLLDSSNSTSIGYKFESR